MWAVAKNIRKFERNPLAFRIAEMPIRLARPDQRVRRDEILDLHRFAVFNRLAGRGLRHVFEWQENAAVQPSLR